MDLIDKEDGALARRAQELGGVLDDSAQIGDACRYRCQGDEARMRRGGDDAGEGGLAAARWPPEDHRGNLVAFQRAAQRAPGRQQVILSQYFVQRAWSHARGEWSGML